MNYTNNERNILMNIGYFYLEKNQREILKNFSYSSDEELLNIPDEKKREYDTAWDSAYVDTERQLIQLGITGCSFDEVTNRITIKLARPGFLIGEKGKNIEALGEYLKNQTGNFSVKIRVEEDNITSILLPMNPRQYNEYWEV